MKPKFLSLSGVRTLVQWIKDRLSEKVDKEDGKALSDNNYSDSDVAKLAGIEPGSQENVIESISVNGTTQTINNKNVEIAVPLVDATVSQPGQAADAEQVGVAINEFVDAFVRTGVRINEVRESIPTATSQLTNDSDFTTKAYVDDEITGVEASIPTKTSQITNDSDYTTKSYVDSELDTLEATVPTKVSQLQNDSSYATTTQLSDGLATKEDTLQYGTATAEDVGKAMMPKTVANGKVTSWEFGEAGKVDDVQIDGVSIINNKVAEIPNAGIGQLGVAQTNPNFGTISGADGVIRTSLADAITIKMATNTYNPIVPSNQHTATFYGLAKAAGDSTQSSSSNAVGTYTDQAKTAIQSMLGIDLAIANAVGDITSFEFQVVNELPATGEKGIIYLVAHSHGANDVYDEYIWVNNGYEKIGNTDIDLSNYATTTYVDSEISTIEAAIPTKTSDITNDSDYTTKSYVDGEIDTLGATIPTNNNQLTNGAGYQTENDVKAVVADSFQDGIEITVSGTTPTITANANTRYICGEVTSLTVTPPESGVTEVIFTAGTTVPTLTLPATVKMPEWFTIESGYTYAINIENATYGTVMMWQT